jgi:phosphate transport system ATP-binding protein
MVTSEPANHRGTYERPGWPRSMDAQPMPAQSHNEPKIRIEAVSYAYGDETALRNVTLDVPAHAVTVLFGPAGGGKTTLMRLINRLNDLVEGTQMSGHIFMDGQDIYTPGTDVIALRRRVGMVFALPLPLPGTVRENVLCGPKLAGVRDRIQLDGILFRSLTQAALWDEVKDRLDDPANALSGGQQQRLCIARSLALEPEVLLLDEPTSGLDPISTRKVEGALFELKQEYTIIVVPHSIQQAARVADYAAFLLMGELVEHRPGNEIFTTPHDQRTEDYITGRFG